MEIVIPKPTLFQQGYESVQAHGYLDLSEN
jgi:hypothetical protein